VRTVLSTALVMALASPVLACINDSELISHEREFRSQYQESQYQPPQPETTTAARPYVLGGAGAIMALAGAGLFLRLRPHSP